MRNWQFYCLRKVISHPFIGGGGQSARSQSVFIIAVVEAGTPNLAQFFNAFFVFCALSPATSCVYVASRVLHTLALHSQTGPEWVIKRLRVCREGVPIRAVLGSGILATISYTCRFGTPLLVSFDKRIDLLI